MDTNWLQLKSGGYVNVPQMPNYLLVRSRFGTEERVAIANFSDEELRDLGKLFGEAMVKHADKKRGK